MNKRGFTLIELLAVIVILGIVLVVTIPNIATSINNNKLSALNTLSKEVAKWYDKAVLNDKISTTKVLGGSIPENAWYCLSNVNGKNIANLYGLSSEDIKLAGDLPSTDANGNIDGADINTTCSAIRLVNGSAEVLLIGKPGGQYSKGNLYSYAVSAEKKGHFYG